MQLKNCTNLQLFRCDVSEKIAHEQRPVVVVRMRTLGALTIVTQPQERKRLVGTCFRRALCSISTQEIRKIHQNTFVKLVDGCHAKLILILNK